MSHLWPEKISEYVAKIWFLWVVCFVVNIITFLFIHYKIAPGNRVLALHYNVLVGVEWYGSGRSLYLIPTVGLMLSLVNLALYRALKDNDNFLSYLTVFVSLCVQIILFLAIAFLARVD